MELSNVLAALLCLIDVNDLKSKSAPISLSVDELKVIKEDKWSAADVAAVGFPPLQASMNCARCLLGESECGYLNDGDDERLSFSIFPNLVVWRKNQASFFLNDPFFLYIMPAKTHIHGQSGTALSSGPFGCKMPYVPV
ncbi:hypothetical protein T01_2112 [Trichinella spiralis]|uniref:Uncharacterized protein n=1 Tax=Trichinella spiralis TaxID=6334 RepID=A0A0V1BBK3_TRISP|nr:hypothetical protein T01_2112 [Trichinella spiralis]